MSNTDPGGSKTPSHIIAAVKWMMVALFAFTLIAVAGRGAAKGLATLDIMFYRSWLGVSILAIVYYGSGRRMVDLRTSQLPLIGLRSGVHFVAQYSWLYALTLIPLTELIAIEFTAPLWTALLAPLFLGERLTVTRLVAAVLGFAGILVVVRPGSITIGPGAMWAFAAAVCFALHYVMTKQLTRRDGAFLLLFAMHLIQAVIATVLVAGSLAVPDPTSAVWVLALTVLGLIAHYSLTQAFSLADAIVVAPMDFLRLPLMAVIGVALYSEPLDPLVMLGAGIVVAANFVNIWGERQRRVAPVVATTTAPAPAPQLG